MSEDLSSIFKAHDHQIDNTPSIFPKGSRIIAFVGKKGSGKSSAMLSLLTSKKSPYHKTFHNILLCSPSAPHDDKMRPLYEELVNEGKYFEELTNDTAIEMKDLLNQLNENSGKKKPNNLIILDDVTQSFPTGRKPSPITQLFTNSRHLKTSIWVVTHKYNSMPSIFRNQLDCIFLYKTNSKAEILSLQKDLPFDEKSLEKNLKQATDVPYGFLYLNLTGPRSKMYDSEFKELDED